MTSQEISSEVLDWDKISNVVDAAIRLRDAQAAQVAADRETSSAQAAFHESLSGLSPDEKSLLGRVPTVSELVPIVNNGYSYIDGQSRGKVVE